MSERRGLGHPVQPGTGHPDGVSESPHSESKRAPKHG